mmetsp:Transcript_15490/g.44836  ORF Transcript_15490/g.44836 Transcript_15490/m.44836 type:complete len:224 (+) Transcript_15490:4165-4836(+)
MNPLLCVKEDETDDNVLRHLPNEVEVDKVVGEHILQRLVEGFAAQSVGEIGEGGNVPPSILPGGNLDLRHDRRPDGLGHAPLFVHLDRSPVLGLDPPHVGRVGMYAVDGQDELLVEPPPALQLGHHPIRVAHQLEDDGTGRIDGVIVRGQVQLTVGVVEGIAGTYLVGAEQQRRFFGDAGNVRTGDGAGTAVELRHELIAGAGADTGTGNTPSLAGGNRRSER